MSTGARDMPTASTSSSSASVASPSPPYVATPSSPPPQPVASTSQLHHHPLHHNGGAYHNSTTTSSSSSSSSSYSYTYELAHYLTTTFAPSVVPQPDEYLAKETARVYLEGLADRVSPGAKLLPFGSMANGFALKNSDMDLCCFLSKDSKPRAASELVETLGALIERETNFHVKMLPRARIPIIKLTMPPTPTVPFGMACDIGFENRLALENTRLLLTYAMIDSRLRTLVLFLKVWTKRRKINNPYRGTLSSYGFVLLVIHFLAQVKSPPVLPNLQQLPPLRQVPLEELDHDGHDISFFDDLEALPQVWQPSNQDNVGDLLIEFFRYYSKDFPYNTNVISIRSETGWLSKESKGWVQDVEYDPEVIVRDQHKLCIEDPFQLDYNVARTVTRDGLYTIRGEFMRAFRLLSVRSPPHGMAAVINDVCEEREDYLVPHPPVDHRPTTRRRSAPSPRMFPNSAHGLPHPPPLVPPPAGSTAQDFRMWAAMNGVQPHPNATGSLDPRAFVREQVVGLSAADSSGSALDDAWDPTSPSVYPSSNAGASPSPSLAASQKPGASGHRPPTASPAAPSLDRRLSWDGSSATAPPPTAGYDLHRFFQNQPGDSNATTATSAASIVSTSPSAASAATHAEPGGPPPRAAMTAPSSPDLGSQSYYTNGGFMSGGPAPGRSYYRYGSNSLGPRASGMPPRHHYGTASHHHYSSQQYSQQQHHLHHSGHHAAGGWNGVSPAPIFPEEDREAIALANSITFGNFPAPSYGGASGSGIAGASSGRNGIRSAAAPSSRNGYSYQYQQQPQQPQQQQQQYLSESSGAANAGPSPRSRTLADGQGSSRGHRPSVNDGNAFGLREDSEEVRRSMQEGDEDEEEEEEDAGARGRRLLNGTIVLPSQDDVGFGVNRQRGRSVPHVRLGPDGRESILFGEIKVVLPRPDDAGEDGDAAELGASVSPRSTPMATVNEGLSPEKRASVPLLTTQPPTPLKQAPSFTSFSPLPRTPEPQSPEFLPAFATPSTVLPPSTTDGDAFAPAFAQSLEPAPPLPASPAAVPLEDLPASSPPHSPPRMSLASARAPTPSTPSSATSSPKLSRAATAATSTESSNAKMARSPKMSASTSRGKRGGGGGGGGGGGSLSGGLAKLKLSSTSNAVVPDVPGSLTSSTGSSESSETGPQKDKPKVKDGSKQRPRRRSSLTAGV